MNLVSIFLLRVFSHEPIILRVRLATKSVFHQNFPGILNFTNNLLHLFILYNKLSQFSH